VRKRGDAVVAATSGEAAAAQPGAEASFRGIEFLKCPECGLEQSKGSLRRGACIQCGKLIGSPGPLPPTDANAGRGAPPCEVCGAKLTATSLGEPGHPSLFYPCGHDKRARSTDPVPAGAPVVEAVKVAARPPLEVVCKAPEAKPPAQSIAGENPDAGDEVSATWGREKYSPVQYNDCDVGPFSGTTHVRAHESRAQAFARLTGELTALAEAERERKLNAFTASLAALGGRK
jgi:hypothetical protein